MKKICLFVTIFFSLNCFHDDIDSFVKVYTDILILNSKEEYSRRNKMLFNTRDSLKKVLEKHGLDEKTYQENLKVYIQDVKLWNTIQKKSVKLLRAKLSDSN